MTAGDSISATDRDLMKRLTVLLITILVVAAGWSQLHLVYSQKFSDVTGEAHWIWPHHRMSDSTPVAFFATREFDLPANRVYAKLKVFGDPEYTLYLNGREIAGRRVTEERQIDLYELTDLVRTGRNRLVIAVRAPQGMGGVIASLDIGPEVENWVVTDETWRIYREWRADLLVRDANDLRWERPVIVGDPPVGRWNFLEVAKRPLAASATAVELPESAFSLSALRPTIRTRSGIAIAVADKVRARAYDFGPASSGRIRATIDYDLPAVSRAIEVRFANTSAELGEAEWNRRPIVFAPGELTVTTPESYDFRYVMVLGGRARIEVVR